MLWRAGSEDSIPNLAGLMFIYIGMANNDNVDQGVANYVFEAEEMAKRMEFFGVHDTITASQPIPDNPDEVWIDDMLLRFVRMSGKVAPDDEAFVYLSKLCRIDSEALILLRDPELSRPPPLAFTFPEYREFLELVNSIPKSIRRSGKVSAAVLLFQ